MPGTWPEPLANGLWAPAAIGIGGALGLTISPIVLSAEHGLSPDRSFWVACTVTAVHSFAGACIAALVDAPATYPVVVLAITGAIACVGVLDARRGRAAK